MSHPICLFPSCGASAAVACGCTCPPSCFCVSHWGTHGISGALSDHKYSRLYSEVSRSEKNHLLSVQSKIQRIKSKLTQEILNRLSENISEIQGKAIEIIKMVQDKMKPYELIVEQAIGNTMLLEEKKDKIVQKMLNGKFRCEYRLSRDLQVTFNLGPLYKNYMFYFERNTRMLRKVGTNGKFSVIEIPSLPENMGSNAGICQLDEQRIACFGGYTNAYMSSCYIINHEAETWESLPPLQATKYCLSATKWNGRVYVFGGSNGSVSATCSKYCLTENRWILIAPLPQASYNVVVAKIKDYFLITGYYLTAIYLYDCEKNTYTSLLNFAQGYKIIIKGKTGKVFLLNNTDRSIYQSNCDDLQNWVKVRSFTQNIYGNIEYHPQRIQDKIYIILDGHRLLEFDEYQLCLKEIQLTPI